MTALISAHGITKRFGTFTAVDHITFDVHKGSVVGFLGPNGAGKTTTIKMIYTAFPPDEGDLTVFGMDTRTHRREIKKRLGVVIQSDIAEEYGTCLDNLRLHASYFGIPWRRTLPIAMQLLESFGLKNRANHKVQGLSGGLKRRVSLAKGLISNPELLLLDEPTLGLDPQARQSLWDLIRQLQLDGKTVLLTTHYMDEAERLCDHIFVIDHGKVIAEGSPSHLISRHLLPNVIEIEAELARVPQLRRLVDQADVRAIIRPHHSMIYARDGESLMRRLSSELGGSVELHLRPANLEDVFLHLTGREMRND